MMSRRSSITRRGNSGFTLVELLVALGIGAVLIALILSVSKSVGNRRTQVQCLNNLREIGSVIHLFSADRRGALPKAYYTPGVIDNSWTSWWRAVAPYGSYGDLSREARSIFVCPSNRTPEIAPGLALKGYPYRVNYNLMTPSAEAPYSTYQSVNLRTLEQPSKALLMLDSKGSTAWGYGFFDSLPTSGNGWQGVSRPHSERANVLWADGHVTLERTDAIAISQTARAISQ